MCWLLLIHKQIINFNLKLREERRLRVFENRILRRIFGPKSDKSAEGFIMRNIIVSTVHLIQSK